MIEEKTKEIELDNIDDQAEDFEEENEQEEKRNILFIGDSYQWGVRANTNFVDEIRNTYGDQFGKIYSICQGGYGFSKKSIFIWSNLLIILPIFFLMPSYG